ncbi:hypothetical protein [Acaryochloris marina]|uniref:Uncharacterized protein n=1 Tax=Acaryochloris marina (strain MBIC 11017) TaxID=329726 RepID=B0C7C2_ACAM1|nr:hypothetical protein [Acaryochloris marina]ABW31206.1 hypothetical protein AM1_6274 [Acaryochloris marina MBIC11017]BDM79897.1 hypothetical protein AM10699_27650 [Acaryochloris marina MBIC10699]
MPHFLTEQCHYIKPIPREDNTEEEFSKTIGVRLEMSVYDALPQRYPGKGERTAWLRKQARIGAENEGLL